MTGRIVLSHVHVSTLRRTRSTEKLISTGLASGGIITLKYILNSVTVTNGGLEACWWWRSLRGRGLAYLEAQTWRCDELSARRSMNFQPDSPANCSAGEGMVERIPGSRSSLPRKVVRPGYMHITAPCLSASPCRQN